MTSLVTPRIGDGPFRRALVLENPDPSLDTHLRALGIEPYRPPGTPNEDQLVELLQQAPYELIFKRSRVQITARVLDAAPHLFAVMLCCIGDDSVDKVACAQRGVLVTNDPISNGRSVAELVIGEMIVLSRRVVQAVLETEQGQFDKSQVGRFEVRGKTLGILGLGNIGKQVAQLAEGLGMRIAFHDNRAVAREVGETIGWTYLPSVRELFAAADIVTVHVSAFDYRGNSNEDLVTYEDFVALGQKDHPSPRLFLNLARGTVHQPSSLLRAADEGHVGGGFVDVFPEEPHDRNEVWQNPYAGHPTIFATPHIGAATLEAQPRIARYVAQTARRLSDVGMLRDCVFSPKSIIGFDALDGVEHLVSVIHCDSRGMKAEVDRAFYDMGLSILGTEHRDFKDYGVAYEVIAVDRAVTHEQLSLMAATVAKRTGVTRAVLAARYLHVANTRG